MGAFCYASKDSKPKRRQAYKHTLTALLINRGTDAHSHSRTEKTYWSLHHSNTKLFNYLYSLHSLMKAQVAAKPLERPD